MTRQERLILVMRAIQDNYIDVHDLVEMLELTVDELVNKFPTRLLEYEDKFIYETDDGDYKTESELEAEQEWAARLEEADQATHDIDE